MAKKSAKKSCQKSQSIQSVGIKMSDEKFSSENTEINNNVREGNVKDAEVVVAEKNIQFDIEEKDVEIVEDCEDTKGSNVEEVESKGDEDQRDGAQEAGVKKKEARDRKEEAVKDEAVVMQFDQEAPEFHPRQQPPAWSAAHQPVSTREPGEPAEGAQVVGLLQELRRFCTEANTDVVLCCQSGQEQVGAVHDASVLVQLLNRVGHCYVRQVQLE